MLRNWSSGTWSKASGKATVELDQMRIRFLYRSPLTHLTSGVTQEPLQGSFIWLCGAPEIPIPTENSESMQKFSDLSCPAVVSRAWSRRWPDSSSPGIGAGSKLRRDRPYPIVHRGGSRSHACDACEKLHPRPEPEPWPPANRCSKSGQPARSGRTPVHKAGTGTVTSCARCSGNCRISITT